MAQQVEAIKVKRLLKNKDYKELVLKQAHLELDALLQKLSAPVDVTIGTTSIGGIEAVRYIQGQVKTTRGLTTYLDNKILACEQADSAIVDIDEEIESLTGQPFTDNQ